MTEKPRVDAGVPAGGQYAAYGHSDQVIALAMERRPELAGWPASYPNPDVSIHVGDDNVLTTTVTIEGSGEIEVYNPGDDVHSVEYNTDGLDGEDCEAAVEWAKDVHEKIAAKIRAEQHAAVERSRAAIIGQVTGDPAPVSDHEMRELYRLHTQAEERAVRYKDLTAAALMSRGVLDAHPEASYVVLSPARGSNGHGIDSVAVFGEGQKHLRTYRADAPYDEATDRYEGEDIVAYLPALQADPKTSYWKQFNVGDFNLTVDVRAAAAWNPAEIA